MTNTIIVIIIFLLSIAAARTAEDLEKKDKVIATIIYFVLLAGPTFLGEALLGAPHFGVLCSVLMVGLVTFLLYLARPKTIIFLNLGIVWLSFWQLFRWADAPGFSWWQVVWVIAIIAAPLLMWRALVLAKKKRKKSSIIAWILVLVSAAISIYLATAYTVGWWPVVVKAETKQEETKQEETKQEETKQEETKQEEMKQEETKQDLKKALTFDEAFLANPELSKIFRSVDLRFDDSSLLPSAKDRNKAAGFSHAVAFPLVDYSEWDSQTRNKEFFKQIIISVLKNPIMADMLAQGFVWDMEVPSLGTTVGNLKGNEFMEEFVTTYSEKGLEEFISAKNGNWEVTPEFRKTAEKLAAILWSASRIRGLETRTSMINYTSNGDLVLSSKIRTYRVTDPKYQTSSEALVLEIPNPKDKEAPELVFGFNRHDRRLEVYPRKAETPEKPKPQPEKPQPKPQPEKPQPKPQPEKPQPKPQPEKPQPKPQPEKPQPKPQPEPEPQPKPQPTPPTPKKPESDPSQKGRADIGGGPNHSGDGKGVFQKEEPKSSETLETENVVEIKKIDNGNPPSDDPDEKKKDSHGDKAGDDNGSFEAED